MGVRVPPGSPSMDRWPSGLRHKFAKLAGVVKCPEGSNPSLSAISSYIWPLTIGELSSTAAGHAWKASGIGG